VLAHRAFRLDDRRAASLACMDVGRKPACANPFKMSMITSCGVLVLNPSREILACQTAGKARWDLPKGLPEPGESARDAAIREAHEEAGVRLDARLLLDLGVFDYLPAKRLHLFGIRISARALDIAACRCRSTFVHPASGQLCPEVNGYAWKPIDRLDIWCGRNLARVLGRVNWVALEGTSQVASLAVD
jgi:8-oxo-dGTP pyrophosphatase MutT (NUDIX family)